MPNGLWTSILNDYTNFGNLTTDDDDAISWFPSSGDVNFIRFIVPFRSLTVHTNTGIYSTPLSDVTAITPSNFCLLLQDSTPADVLQPQAIDNQVFVISGNDAHTMLWDGINNAYTTNIISVPNEQTIRTPVDEAPYADLRRAGSRYVFVINDNGSMAIIQTLQAEGVLGITPQIMEQSYGHAKFLLAASSRDGRAWFIVQREYANGASTFPMFVESAFVLQAVGSNFSTTTPTPITFSTGGSLPTTVPQITTTDYFWAIGIDANLFTAYSSQSDAAAGVNPIAFTISGSPTNNHSQWKN